jgi:DNA-directed RNA polymerase sigma subunit (sigma70/sigma32)
MAAPLKKSIAVDAKLRSMLDEAEPGRPHTLREIAARTGISHQAVRKIEQKALRKIRLFGGGSGQVLSDLLLELRKKD